MVNYSTKTNGLHNQLDESTMLCLLPARLRIATRYDRDFRSFFVLLRDSVENRNKTAT
jgi:hypothetical protein